MKTKIFTTDGKAGKEIDVPKVFSQKIRGDLISKILEAKKKIQPYAPNLMAGKQYAASGKIVHRRHVWRSGYGRGMSRIPRKIISRRGSQFNWIGAEVASTRGGRRAHPPKIISMINHGKINKKELKIAFVSALSATADKKYISSKYQRIDEKDLKELPIIVESKITQLKLKESLDSIKKILGEKIFEISLRKKTIRKGRGKSRGRKYKSNSGILIVLGKSEKMKTGAFTIRNAENLSISDLASGGPGRITIYTEQAIKDIQDKFEGKSK
jgi:large subunit ribosomal protein L4e